MDGVRKLSDIEDFRYRYYKNFKSEELTLENLTNTVPTDPDSYGITATETNLSNYKNFFNGLHRYDTVTFVELESIFKDDLK